MSSPSVKRRLAAILSADVAGYSRLMGDDEEATLQTLTTYRATIEAGVGRHDGRVVGSAGDSFLAEFPSAVEAVRCAVEIQDEIAGLNQALPENRRMAFRIGINLGDVMVEDDNIFGDGVNIAARLETIAEPGGICISRAVYDQVGNKIDLAYEDLGEREVKNIAQPVAAYRVCPADDAGAPAPTAGPAAPPLSDKPSIVVLPFDNMSGDEEQGYFADGIAEDIITDLSKVSGLFVIARNSAFTYKGRAVSIPDVAGELSVRYVVEGSVRKAGQRVRINAQLIDGITGGHLWAERYDRELDDIFAVQDEVTHEIVEALRVNLTPEEEQRIAGRGTTNLEAYDYYLHGREISVSSVAETNLQARELFERAAELDPGFAAAQAGVAMGYVLEYINRWTDQWPEALGQAEVHARDAVTRDESEPLAHFVLGIAHLWRKDLEAADVEARRTLEIEPNSAEGHALLANVRDFTGRSAEAVELFEASMRLDPEYPDQYLHFLGRAHFNLGHDEEAIANFLRRIERNPKTDVSRVLLAAALGQLGRPGEARAVWDELLEVNPGYSLEHLSETMPYADAKPIERIFEGLKKAELP